MSTSLLKSIATRWDDSAALCALVPFGRVFTGRVPQTKKVAMPYVSVLAMSGTRDGRSDKTRYTFAPVTFHIWTNEHQLEGAMAIAEAITDAYADACWSLGDTADVIDVQDGGEPSAYQIAIPTIRAWEVVKLFIVRITRNRADENACG